MGIEPGYQQKKFESRSGLQLIVSPDARVASLQIHQDACLCQLHLKAGESVSHSLDDGRSVYVPVVSGVLSIDGETLNEGDDATFSEINKTNFVASETSEALVFDLP